MDKMEVRGEKKNERVEFIKSMTNKAVETFVDASKDAEYSMAYKAFVLGDDKTSLEAQYALSDLIFTQAAIHLKEYTPHSLEKYTYTTATSIEEEGDVKHLVLWFNFRREKPEEAKTIDLTEEDIKPAFIKKEVVENEVEEDKSSTTAVEDTELVNKITYDA